MIQDPAILANIIMALLIALALVVFFLIATALLRWMADILVARATKRRRMAKSAPEDGSGLLAKDNSQ